MPPPPTQPSKPPAYSASPTMSPIWRTLPLELADEILSHLVAAHIATDPAYTWTRLRHVSAAQKRAIERDFAAYWLGGKARAQTQTQRKEGKGEEEEEEEEREQGRCCFSVSLFFWTVGPMDYERCDVSWRKGARTPGEEEEGGGGGGGGKEEGLGFVDPEGRVTLALTLRDDVPWNLEDVQRAWERYDPVRMRNFTVRLGEGVLNGGCQGGYIVNDTDLPGLEVLEGGRKIRFLWKEAVGLLLQEEMYMRRKGEELFADACKAWIDAAGPAATSGEEGDSNTQMPPLDVQVQLWAQCVQMQRRVAAIKHRAEKAKASGNGPWKPDDVVRFNYYSQNMHGQEVDPEERDRISQVRCCSICSRTQEPDIFETVLTEESVVPQLDVFRVWLEQNGGNVKESISDRDAGATGMVGWETIAELYAAEFGWRCCTVRGEKGEEALEIQQTRAGYARSGWFNNVSGLLVEGNRQRWDLLG
ncbi:hypothetical protein VTK26DRAFT_4065 [Humicola hyalothermophila]